MSALFPVKGIAAIGLMLSASAVGVSGIFTVSGRNILLDGSAFEVRGMCYQPAPIGDDVAAGPPYGDYFTAGYAALWARDFANLRMMGANVIRVYGWTVGADHNAFLDAAYNGADQPLYLLVNKWIDPATDWSNTNEVNVLVSQWKAIANELKNHPAVMGFLIGNEANAHYGNGYDADFWSAMNQIAGAVKAVATNKLVSVAITDALDQVQSRDGFMTNLDFWAVQVYRGHTFGSFFIDYETRSSKPLVITEFGYDAYDAVNSAEFSDDADLPADAMEYLWKEIRFNRPAVSGGCVFEYTDEWWKAPGSAFVHDTTGWPGGAFVDGEGNEEWWGVFRVMDNGAAPDLLAPRAMYYRLAALWNEPFTPGFTQTVTTNGLLQTRFSCPLHLRDQHVRLRMSGDLDTWITVAGNSASGTFDSCSSAFSLTEIEADKEVQIILQYDPSEPFSCDPYQLSANGGFEKVNTLDWLTWGTISSDVVRDGNYSLKLSAAGNYSVPLAFQTTSALPGEQFKLSGYMYTASALPADNTLGLFKIVFRDESGTDLPPASISIGNASGDPAYPGAESVPVLNAASPVASWVFSQVQAVAPSNAVSVSFYLIDVDQSVNTMYFDSIEAVSVADAPVLDDAAFFLLINSGR